MRGSGVAPRPAREVGEFPADRIPRPEGEVCGPVDALEEPAAGTRARRGDSCSGLGRVGKEHTVEPEAGCVGGGGGVLSREEVGVDHTGGEVVGRPEVFL